VHAARHKHSTLSNNYCNLQTSQHSPARPHQNPRPPEACHRLHSCCLAAPVTLHVVCTHYNNTSNHNACILQPHNQRSFTLRETAKAVAFSLCCCIHQHRFGFSAHANPSSGTQQLVGSGLNPEQQNPQNPRTTQCPVGMQPPRHRAHYQCCPDPDSSHPLASSSLTQSWLLRESNPLGESPGC
jgi:hypothetical protein